jgi:DNA-binding PadR family transcriptional regulator
VRLAVLSLLDEGPKNGYQLMKELRERSGGMYRASAGSVYPTLQLLEDEGLIEQQLVDGRRLYRLTDAGREELARDPEGVRRIWQRAERWEDFSKAVSPEMFAFFGPLGSAMKAIARAGHWAAGKTEREARVRDVIQRMCNELDELGKA